MEPIITDRKVFEQVYWKYYLMLEQSFLDVERYLTIDKINYLAFSSEYIKQYQTICSEIDVVAKSYCQELENDFKGNDINKYCKCILDNNSDFTNRIIRVKGPELSLNPWKEWKYKINQLKNGTSSIVSDNPDWWQCYNKIKHNRTTTNRSTGIPYYKLANQENVLNSLAALFQLEMYYFRFLHHKYFSNDPDMPSEPSSTFVIENWGNIWTTTRGGLAFRG